MGELELRAASLKHKSLCGSHAESKCPLWPVPPTHIPASSACSHAGVWVSSLALFSRQSLLSHHTISWPPRPLTPNKEASSPTLVCPLKSSTPLEALNPKGWGPSETEEEPGSFLFLGHQAVRSRRQLQETERQGQLGGLGRESAWGPLAPSPAPLRMFLTALSWAPGHWL